MALGYTAQYQIPYMLDSTPFADVATVTNEMAHNLDQALGRAGVQPPIDLTIPARGVVAEVLRTTPLSRPQNGTGTPSPPGEVNLIVEGTATAYAGRWYRLVLMVPQAGGATTDRLSLRLSAGAAPSGLAGVELPEVQATYQGLTANGGPVQVRSKRLQLPAGPVGIRARAIRDVGSAAWSLYADVTSTIVLSLEDVGKV